MSKFLKLKKQSLKDNKIFIIPQPRPYNLQFFSGFTLVELLVVIGVIAMILAVVFPNFMGARERARDSKRKTDLLEIRKALEIYKLDQNPPSYPANDFLNNSDLCNSCWSTGPNCTQTIYMRKFPCDPQTSLPYIYNLNEADNLKYSLSACLENEADPEKDSEVAAGCTLASYTIYQP